MKRTRFEAAGMERVGDRPTARPGPENRPEVPAGAAAAVSAAAVRIWEVEPPGCPKRITPGKRRPRKDLASFAARSLPNPEGCCAGPSFA